MTPRADQMGSWWGRLALIGSGALAIRVGYVLLTADLAPTADSYAYRDGAILLLDGKGFIDVYCHNLRGVIRQSAQHPPLYLLSLVLPSALGLRSFLAHELWSCLIGTGTVVAVALVARRLAGPRAGLIAAALAALHPGLWLWDGLLMSETLGLLVTSLALIGAYRLWERRSLGSAVTLGATCGLAGLTRAEMVLYLPLVALPFVLAGWRRQLGQRAVLVAVAALAAMSTLAPWLAFNSVRFDRFSPAPSNGLGLVLAQANCDTTYYGAAVGSFSIGCIPTGTLRCEDQVAQSRLLVQTARRYVGANLDRLPAVVAARVARTWGLYRPFAQLRVDALTEPPQLGILTAGLLSYYALVAASLPGLVILRRRSVPVSPLLAVVAAVTVTAAITLGHTRYRASAEAVLVILAAVAGDAWWRHRRARRDPVAGVDADD